MPQRAHKQPRKASARGASAHEISVVPFSLLWSATLSSGLGTLLLTPNTSQFQRLVGVSNNWQLYRFTKLKFRLHRTSALTTSVQAIGYFSGGVIVNPALVTDVMESIHSTCMTAQETIPSSWVSVPRSALSGPLPWYKTVPSATVDVWEENQGQIVLFDSAVGSANFQVEIKGEIELKDPMDSDITLTRPEALEMLRMRMKVIESGGDPSIITAASVLKRRTLPSATANASSGAGKQPSG